MYLKKISHAFLAFAMAVGIVSCRTPSPTPVPSQVESAAGLAQVDLEATYQTLAKSGGTLFSLDPTKSAVKIYAFRSGSLSRLGHNHVLSAPQFTGFFYLP